MARLQYGWSLDRASGRGRWLVQLAVEHSGGPFRDGLGTAAEPLDVPGGRRGLGVADELRDVLKGLLPVDDHTSRLAEPSVDEDVARPLWLGDWDEWQEILSDDSDDDS